MIPLEISKNSWFSYVFSRGSKEGIEKKGIFKRHRNGTLAWDGLIELKKHCYIKYSKVSQDTTWNILRSSHPDMFCKRRKHIDLESTLKQRWSSMFINLVSKLILGWKWELSRLSLWLRLYEYMVIIISTALCKLPTKLFLVSIQIQRCFNVDLNFESTFTIWRCFNVDIKSTDITTLF